MLKDHIDFDKLMSELRDYVAGKGPKPADIATWRLARAGEVCGGCGKAFRVGAFIQEAFADGSIGHATCHAGSTITVTRSRRRAGGR